MAASSDSKSISEYTNDQQCEGKFHANDRTLIPVFIKPENINSSKYYDAPNHESISGQKKQQEETRRNSCARVPEQEDVYWHTEHPASRDTEGLDSTDFARPSRLSRNSYSSNDSSTTQLFSHDNSSCSYQHESNEKKAEQGYSRKWGRLESYRDYSVPIVKNHQDRTTARYEPYENSSFRSTSYDDEMSSYSNLKHTSASQSRTIPYRDQFQIPTFKECKRGKPASAKIRSLRTRSNTNSSNSKGRGRSKTEKRTRNKTSKLTKELKAGHFRDNSANNHAKTDFSSRRLSCSRRMDIVSVKGSEYSTGGEDNNISDFSEPQKLSTKTRSRKSPSKSPKALKGKGCSSKKTITKKVEGIARRNKVIPKGRKCWTLSSLESGSTGSDSIITLSSSTWSLPYSRKSVKSAKRTKSDPHKLPEIPTKLMSSTAEEFSSSSTDYLSKVDIQDKELHRPGTKAWKPHKHGTTELQDKELDYPLLQGTKSSVREVKRKPEFDLLPVSQSTMSSSDIFSSTQDVDKTDALTTRNVKLFEKQSTIDEIPTKDTTADNQKLQSPKSKRVQEQKSTNIAAQKQKRYEVAQKRRICSSRNFRKDSTAVRYGPAQQKKTSTYKKVTRKYGKLEAQGALCPKYRKHLAKVAPKYGGIKKQKHALPLKSKKIVTRTSRYGSTQKQRTSSLHKPREITIRMPQYTSEKEMKTSTTQTVCLKHESKHDALKHRVAKQQKYHNATTQTIQLASFQNQRAGQEDEHMMMKLKLSREHEVTKTSKESSTQTRKSALAKRTSQLTQQACEVPRKKMLVHDTPMTGTPAVLPRPQTGNSVTTQKEPPTYNVPKDIPSDFISKQPSDLSPTKRLIKQEEVDDKNTFEAQITAGKAKGRRKSYTIVPTYNKTRELQTIENFPYEQPPLKRTTVLSPSQSEIKLKSGVDQVKPGQTDAISSKYLQNSHRKSDTDKPGKLDKVPSKLIPKLSVKDDKVTKGQSHEQQDPEYFGGDDTIKQRQKGEVMSKVAGKGDIKKPEQQQEGLSAYPPNFPVYDGTTKSGQPDDKVASKFSSEMSKKDDRVKLGQLQGFHPDFPGQDIHLKPGLPDSILSMFAPKAPKKDDKLKKGQSPGQFPTLSRKDDPVTKGQQGGICSKLASEKDDLHKPGQPGSVPSQFSSMMSKKEEKTKIEQAPGQLSERDDLIKPGQREGISSTVFPKFTGKDLSKQGQPVGVPSQFASKMSEKDDVTKTGQPPGRHSKIPGKDDLLKRRQPEGVSSKLVPKRFEKNDRLKIGGDAKQPQKLSGKCDPAILSQPGEISSKLASGKDRKSEKDDELEMRHRLGQPLTVKPGQPQGVSSKLTSRMSEKDDKIKMRQSSGFPAKLAEQDLPSNQKQLEAKLTSKMPEKDDRFKIGQSQAHPSGKALPLKLENPDRVSSKLVPKVFDKDRPLKMKQPPGQPPKLQEQTLPLKPNQPDEIPSRLAPKMSEEDDQFEMRQPPGYPPKFPESDVPLRSKHLDGGSSKNASKISAKGDVLKSKQPSKFMGQDIPPKCGQQAGVISNLAPKISGKDDNHKKIPPLKSPEQDVLLKQGQLDEISSPLAPKMSQQEGKFNKGQLQGQSPKFPGKSVPLKSGQLGGGSSTLTSKISEKDDQLKIVQQLAHPKSPGKALLSKLEHSNGVSSKLVPKTSDKDDQLEMEQRIGEPPRLSGKAHPLKPKQPHEVQSKFAPKMSKEDDKLEVGHASGQLPKLPGQEVPLKSKQPDGFASKTSKMSEKDDQLRMKRPQGQPFKLPQKAFPLKQEQPGGITSTTSSENSEEEDKLQEQGIPPKLGQSGKVSSRFASKMSEKDDQFKMRQPSGQKPNFPRKDVPLGQKQPTEVLSRLAPEMSEKDNQLKFGQPAEQSPKVSKDGIRSTFAEKGDTFKKEQPPDFPLKLGQPDKVSSKLASKMSEKEDKFKTGQPPGQPPKFPGSNLPLKQGQSNEVSSKLCSKMSEKEDESKMGPPPGQPPKFPGQNLPLKQRKLDEVSSKLSSKMSEKEDKFKTGLSPGQFPKFPGSNLPLKQGQSNEVSSKLSSKMSEKEDKFKMGLPPGQPPKFPGPNLPLKQGKLDEVSSKLSSKMSEKEDESKMGQPPGQPPKFPGQNLPLKQEQLDGVSSKLVSKMSEKEDKFKMGLPPGQPPKFSGQSLPLKQGKLDGVSSKLSPKMSEKEDESKMGQPPGQPPKFPGQNLPLKQEKLDGVSPKLSSKMSEKEDEFKMGQSPGQPPKFPGQNLPLKQGKLDGVSLKLSSKMSENEDKSKMGQPPGQPPKFPGQNLSLKQGQLDEVSSKLSSKMSEKEDKFKMGQPPGQPPKFPGSNHPLKQGKLDDVSSKLSSKMSEKEDKFKMGQPLEQLSKLSGENVLLKKGQVDRTPSKLAPKTPGKDDKLKIVQPPKLSGRDVPLRSGQPVGNKSRQTTQGQSDDLMTSDDETSEAEPTRTHSQRSTGKASTAKNSKTQMPKKTVKSTELLKKKTSAHSVKKMNEFLPREMKSYDEKESFEKMGSSKFDEEFETEEDDYMTDIHSVSRKGQLRSLTPDQHPSRKYESPTREPQTLVHQNLYANQDQNFLPPKQLNTGISRQFRSYSSFSGEFSDYEERRSSKKSTRQKIQDFLQDSCPFKRFKPSSSQKSMTSDFGYSETCSWQYRDRLKSSQSRRTNFGISEYSLSQPSYYSQSNFTELNEDNLPLRQQFLQKPNVPGLNNRGHFSKSPSEMTDFGQGELDENILRAAKKSDLAESQKSRMLTSQSQSIVRQPSKAKQQQSESMGALNTKGLKSEKFEPTTAKTVDPITLQNPKLPSSPSPGAKLKSSKVSAEGSSQFSEQSDVPTPKPKLPFSQSPGARTLASQRVKPKKVSSRSLSPEDSDEYS